MMDAELVHHMHHMAVCNSNLTRGTALPRSRLQFGPQYLSSDYVLMDPMEVP